MGVELCSLEKVLREADFVSLHCRLTPQTRCMIGSAQLALMKPTAFFINVARGELVDQSALVTALRERRLVGAGLDVFETEPLPMDDPLLQLDNVILTPHFGAFTREAQARTFEAVCDDLGRLLRGEAVINCVNMANARRRS